ncbi:MAG: hypothetical protein ACRBBN_05545 [Methyloligellaceae bacterium]
MAKAKEYKIKKLKELVAEAKSVAMSLHPDYSLTSRNPLLWVKVPKAHVEKILDYWTEEDSYAAFKTFVDDSGVLHIHTPYSEYRA